MFFEEEVLCPDLEADVGEPADGEENEDFDIEFELTRIERGAPLVYEHHRAGDSDKKDNPRDNLDDKVDEQGRAGTFDGFPDSGSPPVGRDAILAPVQGGKIGNAVLLVHVTPAFEGIL